MSAAALDGVLLIGFGGPESATEIMPFLRRVVAGRGVPDDRLRLVEAHYLEVGGRSPYNELTARQGQALESWLRRRGQPLPVRSGMRNWHPFLSDTLTSMGQAGLRRVAGAILAPHRSEVSWERYMQDIEAARVAARRPPEVEFLPPMFAETGFIEACAARLEEVAGTRRGHWPADLPVIFTAHSIPVQDAAASSYVQDIETSCRSVAECLGIRRWELAYQSRSGSPRTPWLEPDISAALRARAAAGEARVAVQAIGFLCDHVEVLFDLDREAMATAREVGIEMIRAACVNDHPAFIAMLGEQVLRLAGQRS